MLRTRIQELDNWKNKTTELEKTINHYIIIEKEKKDLERELNNQVRTMEGLKNNIKIL